MGTKIENLVSRLREAASAYYFDNPIMSDADFDSLRDELSKLDPQNDFLSEVGAPIVSSPLQKVNHVIPMGSLNKCGGKNREQEYDSWVRNSLKNSKTEVVVQWKLDGVSIELVYDNGKFVQAITRGDGKVGEDVTDTISFCAPKQIKGSKGRVYIRAEAVIKIPVWKQYFSQNFSNPRNTVSGLVRRVSDTSDAKHVSLIAYDIVGNNVVSNKEFDKIVILSSMGFNTVETIVCQASDIAFLSSSFENRRDEIEYEVDGTVIKINDISLQQILGEHDGRPKYAIAWKFAARGGFSTIKDIEWSVGTGGRITPVAIINPIPVSGVTISRVTLHNADEIDRLGVQVGDTVEVIRSGDVIPKITRVTKTGYKRIPIKPLRCPSCDGLIAREGPMWMCVNDDCKGVAFRKLEKWVQKRNIMHLGSVYIHTLYDNGVTDIPDLYSLDIPGLIAKGVPGGMATKIYAEIEKSKNVKVAEFIGSLSIDMLGRSEARNLVKLGIDTVSKFLELTEEDLMKFDGYKSTKANRIVSSIAENSKLILTLVPFFNIITEEKEKKMGSGKASPSFCFTGSASLPRKELQEMVINAGGTVLNSVTKGLDYLVMADPDSQSTKAVKARNLGVKLIGEAEFFKMIGAK